MIEVLVLWLLSLAGIAIPIPPWSMLNLGNVQSPKSGPQTGSGFLHEAGGGYILRQDGSYLLREL